MGVGRCVLMASDTRIPLLCWRLGFSPACWIFVLALSLSCMVLNSSILQLFNKLPPIMDAYLLGENNEI